MSIGDYVWFDGNGNALQDQGEEPAPGVVVNLFDTNGSMIATTVTDANGYYSFTDLQPSTEYLVEIITPEGYVLVFPDAGNDDAEDSDFHPFTGQVTVITPATGANQPSDGSTWADDPTIHAGLRRPHCRRSFRPAALRRAQAARRVRSVRRRPRAPATRRRWAPPLRPPTELRRARVRRSPPPARRPSRRPRRRVRRPRRRPAARWRAPACGSRCGWSRWR